MTTNLYTLIRAHARSTPDKLALVFKDQRLDYRQLIDQVDQVGSHLHTLGVRQGTHIAVFANNSLEFVVLLLAIARLGAIIVPLPLTLRGTYRQLAITRTDCTFVIGWFTVIQQLLNEKILPSERLIALGRDVPGTGFYDKFLIEEPPPLSNPNVPANSPYILTMTSGSTGDPKPIVFSQETKIRRAFDATADLYSLSANDVVLVSTPLYHSLAQRSVLMPLMLGGTAIVLSKFTPKSWLEAVARERVSFLFAVSSQLEILLSTPELTQHDLSSLRRVISSSAPLSNTSKQALLNRFDCDIREIYGASEIGVATDLSLRDDHDKYASVGWPLPFVTIRIVDEQRRPLPANAIGEIACRTTTGFLGYYRNPEATNASMNAEGYFHTGDLGYLDEDGFLYYVGRKKELIITGGINVYPRDIEEVITNSGLVAECAVIGVPSERFGEAVLAIVCPKPGEKIDLIALRQACTAQLADHQLPQAIEILPELPRNPMGKVLKTLLKDRFCDHQL